MGEARQGGRFDHQIRKFKNVKLSKCKHNFCNSGDGETGLTIRSEILKCLIITFVLQVRDEYRTDFDSGRGGYGKIVQQKLETPDGLL